MSSEGEDKPTPLPFAPWWGKHRWQNQISPIVISVLYLVGTIVYVGWLCVPLIEASYWQMALAFLVIYGALVGMCLWCMWYIDTFDSAEVVVTPQMLSEGLQVTTCKYCHRVRPPRTHHCSSCDRCVLRQDHHCPIVGNCVSLHTHKAFLLFLCYHCVLTGFVMLSVILSYAATSRVWFSFVSMPSRQLIAGLLVVALLLLDVCAGSAALGMAPLHAYLVSRNLTTREWGSSRAKLYARKGCRSNCAQVFGSKSVAAWFIPVASHDADGYFSEQPASADDEPAAPV